MTQYSNSPWGSLSEVISNAAGLTPSVPGVTLDDCGVYKQLMEEGQLQALEAAFRRADGSNRTLRLIGNGGTGMVFEELLPDGSLSPDVIRIGPDILQENVVIKGKRTVLEPTWHATVNVNDSGYLITSSPKVMGGSVSPEQFHALKAAANAEGVDFVDAGDARSNYNGNIMFLADGTPVIIDGARDIQKYAEDPELSPSRKKRAERELGQIQENGKKMLQNLA